MRNAFPFTLNRLFPVILLTHTPWPRPNLRGPSSIGSSNFKGVILAITAGLIFGCYLVPLKLSKLQPTDFLFPMSLGILIGGLAIYFTKSPKFDKRLIVPGTFSGLIWNIVNFTSFFAVLSLGISIGFALTQMALFISVLWGLLYFHEIRSRNKVIRLSIGAVVLFTGAILLGLSIQVCSLRSQLE